MKHRALRTAGVVAGIIVVLGVLVIGAQYLSQTTGGASAQVLSLEDLPPTVQVSKEDFTVVLSQLNNYWVAGSLAEKNKVVADLQEIVLGLTK